MRLGSSEVQVERTGGDGVSANTPGEILCRFNRTLLSRNVPLSYRIFVNNAWQYWTYAQSGSGNIYKNLLMGYDIWTRCVRYPSAEEKEQFEKGYAIDVVTSY